MTVHKRSVASALMCLLMVVLALAGCTHSNNRLSKDIADWSCASKPPADSPGVAGTGARLVLSTDHALAGEQISFIISVPRDGKIIRGIDSYFECWSGHEWRSVFVLFSGPKSAAPDAQPFPLPEGRGIDAVGLQGIGPEYVKLPTGISAGWYRIRKEVIVDGETSTLYSMIKIE